MGSNVFGTPITKEMLETMPKYRGKEAILQKDKAIVALNMKNAEGKDINAKKFVQNLKNEFKESTMCLIYNATGETITYVTEFTWKGRLCESPYPVIIANGQWGAFLHGKAGEDGSKVGIVYSVLNNQGREQHWFMGFHNAFSLHVNRVYTEIGEVGKYTLENSKVRDALDSSLDNNILMHQTNEKGGLLFGSIGNDNYPVFEAILTLPEAIRG